MTTVKINNQKDLTGKFIVKAVDQKTTYFVKSNLGSNRYEMIDCKTKKAYCIDIDCMEVLEVLKYKN